MSLDDPAAENSKGKNAHDVPDQMIGAEDAFAEHLAHCEPETAIEWARYFEAFPYRPRYENDKVVDPEKDDDAYLFWLMQAAFFRDVQSVREWKQYAGSYFAAALTEAQVGRPDSPPVKVRAHYLNAALSKLLSLLDAPAAMVDDVQSILELHKPRSADVRADAQKELVKHPTASARAIAKKLPKRTNRLGEEKIRDHSQISTDLKNGRLVRPASYQSQIKK